MCNNMTFEDIMEQKEQVLIPEYLYICIPQYGKIPNRKQIDNCFEDILTISNIEYDMSKNGIIYGIYVYFKYINLKNFGIMINKIMYGGASLISIEFKNSIENREIVYDVMTESMNSRRYVTKGMYGHISSWDTYSVTNMRDLFSDYKC